MQSVVVGRADAGRRIDKFLMRYLDAAPVSFIYKSFRKKNIKLRGRRAVGDEVLNEGDLIELFFSDETLESLRKRDTHKRSGEVGDIEPQAGLTQASLSSASESRARADLNRTSESRARAAQEKPLHTQSTQLHRERMHRGTLSRIAAGDKTALAAYCDIVYEDDELVLADKHYGVLSQKASNADYSLNEALIDYCGGNCDGSFMPSVVNRIDRNTTGLVCFAKTYLAARELSRLIREHETEKYYIAAVAGRVTESAHIEAWLKKDKRTNKVTIYEQETNGADHIETVYRPIAARETELLGRKDKSACGSIGVTEYTLLKVRIITGRSHQIRAQLAYNGHAILGDPKYGDAQLNKRLREEYGIGGQLLHAWELRFPQSVAAPLEYLAGRSFRTKTPDSFILLDELRKG